MCCVAAVLSVPYLYAATATQPAAETLPASRPTTQPAEFPSLEPAIYPPGITTEKQYSVLLQKRVEELASRLADLGDPDARAEAALNLAAFALTRAIEPALSARWLGIESRHLQPVGLLQQARLALSEADSIRLGKEEAEEDVTELTAKITKLTALAEMLEAILPAASTAGSEGLQERLLGSGVKDDRLASAALSAAKRADELVADLDPSVRPVWQILIAACLARAGRYDAALLRLRPLLPGSDDQRVGVFAAVLQARILAARKQYAAATALLAEYETKASRMWPALPERPSLCTLRLVHAELLRRWAESLKKTKQPANRQTALLLYRQAEKALEQARLAGPYCLRLVGLAEMSAAASHD